MENQVKKLKSKISSLKREINKLKNNNEPAPESSEEEPVELKMQDMQTEPLFTRENLYFEMEF